MLANLRVGTDAGAFHPISGGAAPNHQLVGNVDDIVALGKVLTAAEIMALRTEGAEALAGLSTVGP